MKTLFTAAAMAAAFMLAACAGTPKHTASPYTADTTPVSAGTTTLVVHGMGCPLCASNVDTQLKRLDGVINVATNLGNGRVDVLVGPGASPTRAQLAEAVRRSGMTLVKIATQ